MRDALRRHWLLAVFLVIGTLLRAAMLVAVPLPLMTFTDANVYVFAANEFLFRPAEGRTAGYPLVLRILHEFWASPTLPIVVQHVSVLLGSVALYAIARTASVPRVLSALAAGVWLVSIDWIWLEHQLLTETLGTVLIVGAFAVIALAPSGRQKAWAVGIGVGLVAGALALGAGIVRPALFAALPGIGLAVLMLLRTPVRVRLVSALVLVLTCGALLAGYLKVQDDHTGFGARLVGSELDMGGYPFVAPVASCDEFQPPPGTRSLCEATPPDARPAGDWYYWDPASPGRQLLAARPDLAASIKAWAARAIVAQGDDVRRYRLMALERLFGVGGFRRPLGDQGTEVVSLRGADTGAAPVVIGAVQTYYGKEDAPNRPAGAPYGLLEDLQTPTRPPGLLLLIAFVVGCAGALFGLGRARRLAIAAGVAGWLPTLYATWTPGQFNWRYALVSIPLVALSSFAAISALDERRRALRRRTPPDAEAGVPARTEQQQQRVPLTDQVVPARSPD